MPSGDNAAGLGRIAPGDRTGRVGVMYVRGILAQAGIENNETSPGEDYGAIDLKVGLPSATVGVQVKAGRKRRLKTGGYSVSVEPEWCDKWKEQKVPVYLVLVVLSKEDFAHLIDHRMKCTTWHAHAYWAQVNDARPKTVRVSEQNRFDLRTLARWDADVRSAFTKGSP